MIRNLEDCRELWKVNERVLEEETKRKSRSRNFIVNLALKLFLEKTEKERDKLYP